MQHILAHTVNAEPSLTEAVYYCPPADNLPGIVQHMDSFAHGSSYRFALALLQLNNLVLTIKAPIVVCLQGLYDSLVEWLYD